MGTVYSFSLLSLRVLRMVSSICSTAQPKGRLYSCALLFFLSFLLSACTSFLSWRWSLPLRINRHTKYRFIASLANTSCQAHQSHVRGMKALTMKSVLSLPMVLTSYGMPCPVSNTLNSSLMNFSVDLLYSEKNSSVGSPT
jgi:hypothetical protein